MAGLGVFVVKNDWVSNAEQFPDIEPRKNPRDTDYDLHVNVMYSLGAAYVSAQDLSYHMHEGSVAYTRLRAM